MILLLLLISSICYSNCLPEELSKRDHTLNIIQNQKFKLELKKKKKKSYYDVFKGKLISRQGKSTKVTFFQTHKKSAPVVFYLSGLGGENFLDQNIGHYFASRGVHFVMSHYRESNNSFYDAYDETLRNIAFTNALVDLFKKRQEVNKDKMSVIAVSFGGLRAMYLATIRNDISSFKLIISGADFPQMMRSSKLTPISKIRKAHMKELDTKDKDFYEEEFNKIIPYNPSKVLCNIKSKFYFHISSNDTWVPTKTQRRLANSVPSSEKFEYSLGHVGTFLWWSMSDLPSTLTFLRNSW